MNGQQIHVARPTGLLLLVLAVFIGLTSSPTSDCDAAEANAAEPIDFDTQVIPVLTRSGCNAGSCHGAAAGRGGFHLSLWGSDPAADHDAIVHQLEGRRVHTLDPDQSLLLRKPSQQTDHEGGLVLPEDSAGFELLKRWIAAGAPRHNDRSLVDLDLQLESDLLPSAGHSVHVRLLATFDTPQGQLREDVTPWVVFKPDDADAVTVDESGTALTVHRRGVQLVVARYLDRVMPIRLVVPMHDSMPSPTSASSVVVSDHPIDRAIDAQLQRLRLPSSPVLSDLPFLRRVTLDLQGRLPTLDEIESFRSDDSPDKRSKVIRQLLDSDQFADYWALKWANQLGIDSKALQVEGAATYHRWLADQLRNDTPMDKVATAMLTATGDGHTEGPVNFLRSGGSPGELAQRISNTWMGVRLQCADCHDHPLDHWRQQDYHGLAAIFAKLQRGRVVAPDPSGEVTDPVSGQAARPRIPGERFVAGDEDGRHAFAQWLTRPSNPYFAPSIVNRVWRHLMGRGLVHPVDDLRSTNPPSHPELLSFLAEDFVTHHYSVKQTIELICNSAAYQRDSQPVAGNEHDQMFYSHAHVKPLEAEVVADAISEVTGVPLQSDRGEIDRAVGLLDNRTAVPALDILGRCDRESGCSETGQAEVSLARSLHLIHGDLVNARIRHPRGRLHQRLNSSASDEEILNELFLMTLTLENQAQSAYWQSELQQLQDADQATRRAFFEDVLWGLLTSDSFLSNR